MRFSFKDYSLENYSLRNILPDSASGNKRRMVINFDGRQWQGEDSSRAAIPKLERLRRRD